MKLIRLAISVCALAIGAGVAEGQVSDEVVKIGVLNDQSGLYADVSGPSGLTAVSTAIRQHERATGEIASSTQQASNSTAEVGSSIRDVDQAAASAHAAAGHVLIAATRLGGDVEALRANIQDFLTQIRAA